MRRDYWVGHCVTKLVTKSQKRTPEEAGLDPRVNWGEEDTVEYLLWNGSEYRSPLWNWLNDRGAEGWELVAMTPRLATTTPGVAFQVVLKRPREDERTPE